MSEWSTRTYQADTVLYVFLPESRSRTHGTLSGTVRKTVRCVTEPRYLIESIPKVGFKVKRPE